MVFGHVRQESLPYFYPLHFHGEKLGIHDDQTSDADLAFTQTQMETLESVCDSSSKDYEFSRKR